ncbi:phosphoribosylanthranilate isomerase [SAR202 cluster bacterium AD-804-J14_MRT_500m]|nr:phosphoribosylanthranilate isomerase [SAR202 cluster bacterium AD-804-J14_MRT_500m]
MLGPRLGNWRKRFPYQRVVMIKIKICGLRKPKDAVEAVEAGADFIGLVFVPGRRRMLTDESAKEIVVSVRDKSGASTAIVGLFADQPLDEVNRFAYRYQLDMVQLCGNESLDYCSGVKVPVIKVIHIRQELDHSHLLERLGKGIEHFQHQGCVIALDSLVEGLQGGTGKTFDWSIAEDLKNLGYEFILAGGLNPNNVGEAIRRIKPWGVDVSSGVENNGIKDPQKIHVFVERARLASGELKAKKDHKNG